MRRTVPGALQPALPLPNSVWLLRRLRDTDVRLQLCPRLPHDPSRHGQQGQVQVGRRHLLHCDICPLRFPGSIQLQGALFSSVSILSPSLFFLRVSLAQYQALI